MVFFSILLPILRHQLGGQFNQKPAMTAFFITVFGIYFLFLILLLIGWNTSTTTERKESSAHFLSIIIPFRNEEVNLFALVESLLKLDYPKEKFEVLLINDHSTDDSLNRARQLSDNYPNIKIVTPPSNGKKNAIAYGVEISNGEIIVTTDADCEVPKEWLASINNQFQNRSICMVVGAVRVKSDNSFFSKLQAMEFSSLIGSAASSLSLGFPTMANGANLSYRKHAFVQVNGYDGNTQIASGDDEFLMRKVIKEFGVPSLKFLKDSNAVVTTGAQKSIADFLIQRIRWAGKWRHNSDFIIVVLSIFILLFQTTCLAALGSLFFVQTNSLMLVLIIAKIFLEGLFLFFVSRFLKQKFYSHAFFLLQILYPVYVIVVGILSNLVRVSWKGRSI